MHRLGQYLGRESVDRSELLGLTAIYSADMIDSSPAQCVPTARTRTPVPQAQRDTFLPKSRPARSITFHPPFQSDHRPSEQPSDQIPLLPFHLPSPIISRYSSPKGPCPLQDQSLVLPYTIISVYKRGKEGRGELTLRIFHNVVSLDHWNILISSVPLIA
jgi:hypothetical protein